MSSRQSKVDSYRFLDLATRRLVKAWIEREPKRTIPWTPLQKPLSQCRIALVSTAALCLTSDRPFDQDGERANPWWGDPSFRVIPHDCRPEEVRAHHLHVDTSPVEEDLNCTLPIARLQELVDCGKIGAAASSHYSFMGYQLDSEELLLESTPEMTALLHADEVDLVLLAPY